MMKRILSLLLCLLCFTGSALAAPAFEPKDCPKDLKYILGMYYGNGELFLLRENKGEVEAEGLQLCWQQCLPAG